MDLQPGSAEKIRKLIAKGVAIPNPATIDIGPDVCVDQISTHGVTLYPGCRIYGSKTVIAAGCKLGAEAPVTLENCQLDAAVELKGGFASQSVFLEQSSLGMGGHVREACLLEEQASGAHSVGLKQTILFPFVTLGSLINFCDGLMAGGTSRSDHSEVGSSYIHFNYTPDADKSTASLLGDVPRGVMLNQRPIFLGGQGGMVGPLRLGFGNVVAAGTILRKDYPQDGQLISEPAPTPGTRPFIPALYPDFKRVVENNLLYLANLKALKEWYKSVRKPFFETREFGSLIFTGALDVLALARRERFKRFQTMISKANREIPSSISQETLALRRNLFQELVAIESIFGHPIDNDQVLKARDVFLEQFSDRCRPGVSYLETIRALPPAVSAQGTFWLQKIVDCYCQKIATVITSAPLFRTA